MKVTGRKKSENENEWWIQLENRMKKSFKPQRNQKKEVKVNETFSNHSESNEPNGSQWIPMDLNGTSMEPSRTITHQKPLNGYQHSQKTNSKGLETKKKQTGKIGERDEITIPRKKFEWMKRLFTRNRAYEHMDDYNAQGMRNQHEW